MTRLIVWSAAATVLEVAGLMGVVHTLLRYAMRARGLPGWRMSDTLLTSPALWLGVATAAAALNWLVAGSGMRACGRCDIVLPGVGVGVGVASTAVVLGALIAWLGLRAVGKLY